MLDPSHVLRMQDAFKRFWQMKNSVPRNLVIPKPIIEDPNISHIKSLQKPHTYLEDHTPRPAPTQVESPNAKKIHSKEKCHVDARSTFFVVGALHCTVQIQILKGLDNECCCAAARRPTLQVANLTQKHFRRAAQTPATSVPVHIYIGILI